MGVFQYEIDTYSLTGAGGNEGGVLSADLPLEAEPMKHPAKSAAMVDMGADDVERVKFRVFESRFGCSR